MFRFRAPLAWHNLTYDRLRFGLFVAGVGFAVVLMYVQYGFRNALIDSTVRLIHIINDDVPLFLISRRHNTFAIREAFPRRRLAQALSVAGVRAADALQIEYSLSTFRQLRGDPNHPEPTETIRVLGIDLDRDLLKPEIGIDADDLKALRSHGNVLYDVGSRVGYPTTTANTEIELAGRRVRVAGTFRVGADFGTGGNLIVSSETFDELLRPFYLPDTMRNEVELGLIRVDPGKDPVAVRDAINAALAHEGDVEALTRAQLIDREKTFWLEATPIGVTFYFGMVMGFVVGVVICYQILSTDVADHLPEYATLKAIGYGNRYLVGVVLQEAVLLGLLGFIPGTVASWLIYRGLSAMTGLPMELTPERAGLVLLLTVVMCSVSGCMALRRALAVDPAEVF
jgi:putative ABC transport system permease protein